ILAVDDLAYQRGPLLAQVSPSHAITALTAVMMSAVVVVGLIFRPHRRVLLGLTWISLGLFVLYILNSFIEPPCTAPYARWCGRGRPRGLLLSRLGVGVVRRAVWIVASRNIPAAASAAG
ncbi:MAG: hypothetical protein Q8Q28_00035, partial [Pseudomonadota bacterium]|nr:hypothetical protein [Pseudomonadota bacterium]